MPQEADIDAADGRNVGQGLVVTQSGEFSIKAKKSIALLD